MLGRKKELEILLSKLAPSPKPKLQWEGYSLDAGSAAEMASIAGWMNNDIQGKRVSDLGCGSGILAIAASLLGAEWVMGVDIDRESILAARKNADETGAAVDFMIGDISCLTGHFDTVLMNPPFGSWHRGADVNFLQKALKIANVVYSLHKSSSSVRAFLEKKIPILGGQIDKIHDIEITIRRTYSFHQKNRYIVRADLYRIQKK